MATRIVSGVSAGEAGGILSAGIVVLVATGKGLQWLMTFGERRAESRALKLQQWHEELDRREQSFDAKLDARLLELERENRARAEEGQALRMAFELVAGALRAIDPRNTALARAEQLLQAAFPLLPIMPAAMAVELRAIDRTESGGENA